MALGLNSKDMESYVLPLRHLLGELKPKKVLEVGIGYDAYSTQVWLEDDQVHLTTVDKADWGGLGQKISGQFPDRYHLIIGQSEDVLPTLPDKYDLIYIDGDHAYEGAKSDIINCMKLVTDGVILIDDYGVAGGGGLNIDERGMPTDGDYGVKRATDELFDKNWERVYTHIAFGNGGVAFRRVT